MRGMEEGSALLASVLPSRLKCVFVCVCVNTSQGQGSPLNGGNIPEFAQPQEQWQRLIRWKALLGFSQSLHLIFTVTDETEIMVYTI